MKKLVSVVILMSFILSMIVPKVSVYAESNITSNPNFKGELFYEEDITETTLKSTVNASSYTTSLSSLVNDDDSITIFEYKDNELVQENTTIPGSGVVNRITYNKDGTSTSETIYTMPLTKSSSSVPDRVSKRPLGTMNYLHSWTNEVFTISCAVHESYFQNRPYTFNKGAADTLSGWTARIISVLVFHKVIASKLALAVFLPLSGYGVFDPVVNGVYRIAITKTITCNYYNQEIHGTPTKPVGRGKAHFLAGTYAYVNYGSGPVLKTEGFTVRDWGKATMGRLMMYNVFGIDDSPTSWTTVGSRMIQNDN